MKNIKPHHIVSALAMGGILVAVSQFGGSLVSRQPPFQNLNYFVLFADEEIKLEQGVQVSSGDLGSNKTIDIQKNAIITGNLFADKITIDKDSQINGNASYNKLQIKKESQILGTQTKPVSLPIANLPQIPDFQVGTQDFKFEGKENTLSSGNYRDVVLEKDSRLILTGGIYNLRKLELKENSTLIFNAPTTLNIQFKLRGHNKVSILPGLNVKPDDLQINYLGIKPKKEKEQKDDDDEINQLLDDQEKKDHKAGKIGRPAIFGEGSLLNFKLLAPKANIKIGEEATLRSQILARKIMIGKDSLLSREEDALKKSDPTKILEVDQVFFQGDEILLLLKPEATLADAEAVANLVNGRITGTIIGPNIFKIELATADAASLDSAITTIKNFSNPLMIEVAKNSIFTVE